MSSVMAHIAPGDYAIHHGREAPPYNAGTQYYNGGDYLGAQMHGDLPSFHRPQHHFHENAATAGLADAFAGIDISPSAKGKPMAPPNKELVVHAIEAAASALRDQASALQEQITENERLRSALRVREWELQNYKMDQVLIPRTSENPAQEDVQTPANVNELGPTTPEKNSLLQGPTHTPLDRDVWAGNGFLGDPQSSLIVHPDAAQSLSENFYRYSLHGVQGQQYGSNFGANGAVRSRNLPDAGFSHTSSPITRPMSPMRLGREVDLYPIIQRGMLGSSQLGQELVRSAPRPQDEIKHLKKLVSDCTLKEMQLVHENHMLEQRISELRLTIEKYQQELVEARENSIPHDILEENARLTSEIRAAAQDVNFYASSLMPLLMEFNLPATRDPHSIVSGIKTLIQHLREEGRRDGLPSKQPWRSPQMYQSSQHGVSTSPVHPTVWAPKSPEPHGLEIVPQQAYLPPERPRSPPSSFYPHNMNEWDVPNADNPHGTNNYTGENVRRPPYSGGGDAQHASSLPSDYSNLAAQQRNNSFENADEGSNGTGHSYSLEYTERPERMSPPLPPLPEEPPSSLSDDEDPLPDIEGLTINGDAVLGNKITACGISINGTTLCHFQWVRHHRDESFTHIPGAAQPEYTITADDVDALLSLECTPMDDRNRKGEMVQVFFNNHSPIDLDSDMNDQIIEYLENGQTNFEVKLLVESSQDVLLDPVILSLKRSLYELKRANGKRIVGSERYVSESAQVEVKVGKDAQCAIISTTGIMHSLDCNDNRGRDLLVLTMREFIKAAMERKRGKKRLWLK